MKQKIFLIIGIILLSIFGISIFQEFMANHTYYKDMFASRDNRKIVIRIIVAAVIPLWYIIKAKTFSLKRFFVRIIPITILFFSVAFTMIKEGVVGGSAGFLILCVNSLLLYFLGMYFILGVLAFGTWISNKWIKFKELRWQEMFLNFGIGLGILLLLLYVISFVGLFYGGITWILFLSLGGMIYLMKHKLKEYTPLIATMFEGFNSYNLKKNRWKRLGIILLGISIIYYLYGFQLSFIPYSTAWDANHEYMYIPKVLAENAHILRGNVGPLASVPYLRHIFIAFWFSLIQPIKSRFWLSPDTIAVAMNFLSGIFVLVFGLGLVEEVLAFFGKKNDQSTQTGFAFGWAGLLFWLTSGMGAFLVFVDNKTDLGVLALTILALLSGFVFLKFISDSHERGEILHVDALKYVIVSGFFFALACLAKPTAFIDVALFGLLMVGLWIDILLSVGLGVMTIGLMGVLTIGNAADMMSTGLGKRVMLIGAIIVILALIRLFLKKSAESGAHRKIYIRYIVIWAITCIATVVVFKGPNILITQINDGSISVGNWAKGLLIGSTQKPNILLTATATPQVIAAQTPVDQGAINQASTTLSLDACKAQTFSSGDLYTGLKQAVVTNEDVGRYVGYGWKEITRGSGMSLGYYLLRVFYPINNTCYGLNHDAKLLCTKADAINKFDVQTLKTLFTEVNPNGKAYGLLSGALAAYEAKYSGALAALETKFGSFTGAVNPTEFNNQITALSQYYQDHAIKTEAGKIEVPYRYIVPFNVVFNRSLQNLSSYYTDIGFIWMFMLVFVVCAFIYALIKKEKNLTVLSATTVIGWTIRRIIGGGIVWYGIGLIMWTILTVSMFVKDLLEGDEENKGKQNMVYVFFFLFAVWAIIQFMLNFIRIASQGAGGPFLWYKMGNGQTVQINDQLQQQQTIQSDFGWKDVFDLQFPHYNKFIEYVKNRPNTDGILIAGTYIQYFLKNQHNIKSDGMLDRFWEQTSDDNSCKSYKRLQDQHIKYLVIDPNIGTVTMGAGNESLFNRFFAELDPVTGKIKVHGAMTRLAQLWSDGYISLFSTNNLGAKYAFTLDDQTLLSAFPGTISDDLVLLRAKLAIARFFPNQQELLSFIADTFAKRLLNGEAVGDIADVYGKTVDETKILDVAVSLIKQTNMDQVQAKIQNLTQDERMILTQYVGLVNLLSAKNPQYQDYVQNLMSQSLGGGSQLVVFELK